MKRYVFGTMLKRLIEVINIESEDEEVEEGWRMQKVADVEGGELAMTQRQVYEGIRSIGLRSS